VKQVALVAPYLCYMRQDTAFHPGEVVSQRIVGRFLAERFDTVVTVDPHLHRVHSLAEAVPARQAVALSAAPEMGAFLAHRGPRVLLVGPDSESRQWVQSVAGAAGCDYVVAEKTRRGDRSVAVELPARDYAGLEVVLVDDLASTGRTLAEAASELYRCGAKRVDALVTHGLFVEDALDVMKAAGVTSVWSSDSVPHETNAFALAPLLAQALR
jgi:ribose-phosphate pyrophosphokinase